VAGTLTIGEVARRAGVNTSHIRYYERIGVLPPAPRSSGQRRYSTSVLDRLAIIDVAQRAGFTLEEIKHLTGPTARRSETSDRVRELADRKLPEIQRLITRAQAVHEWLALAATCDCRTVDVCALFTDPTLAPPPGGLGPVASDGSG
jgi:DNA-binding transcriptional MerR regulator